MGAERNDEHSPEAGIVGTANVKHCQLRAHHHATALGRFPANQYRLHCPINLYTYVCQKVCYLVSRATIEVNLLNVQ